MGGGVTKEAAGGMLTGGETAALKESLRGLRKGDKRKGGVKGSEESIAAKSACCFLRLSSAIGMGLEVSEIECLVERKQVNSPS